MAKLPRQCVELFTDPLQLPRCVGQLLFDVVPLNSRLTGLQRRAKSPIDAKANSENAAKVVPLRRDVVVRRACWASPLMAVPVKHSPYGTLRCCRERTRPFATEVYPSAFNAESSTRVHFVLTLDAAGQSKPLSHASATNNTKNEITPMRSQKPSGAASSSPVQGVISWRSSHWIVDEATPGAGRNFAARLDRCLSLDRALAISLPAMLFGFVCIVVIAVSSTGVLAESCFEGDDQRRDRRRRKGGYAANVNFA